MSGYDIKAKKILEEHVASVDVSDFEKVLAALEWLSKFSNCYVTGTWAKDVKYSYFYVKCRDFSLYLGRSVKLVEIYAKLREIGKLAGNILEDFKDLVDLYKEFRSKVSDLG
jgi:phenylalanyl-tRNA synthetase beta subunit